MSEKTCGRCWYFAADPVDELFSEGECRAPLPDSVVYRESELMDVDASANNCPCFKPKDSE